MTTTISFVGGTHSQSITFGGPPILHPFTGPVVVNVLKHAVVTATIAPYVSGQSVTFNVADATLNLADGSQLESSIAAVVNLSGNDIFHLDVQAGSSASVNLAAGSTWTGGLYVHAIGNHDIGGPAFIYGSGSFHNQASEIDASQTTIAVAVTGSGTFGMGLLNTYSGATAILEFSKAVSAGQTITMANAAHPLDAGLLLRLDDPKDFHASVNFMQGSIDLVGLANADSYSFKNDMLTLFSGKTVIDTLRLHDSTQYGFRVEHGVGSINIVSVNQPVPLAGGVHHIA